MYQALCWMSLVNTGGNGGHYRKNNKVPVLRKVALSRAYVTDRARIML